MRHKKFITVDDDFIVQKHRNGVKLLNPNLINYKKEYSIKALFNSSLNIIFLNRASEIQKINKNNAMTFGHDSTKSLLGKTIRDIYKSGAAYFSITHDREVIDNGRVILKEEKCERMDNIAFNAITAKLPWYDHNNTIIGLIGCSIPVGLDRFHDMQSAISACMDLNWVLKEENPEIVIHKKIGNVTLTQRQSECLYHIVHGKTAKQLACILGLSKRTVESYIDGLKMKLNVSSKSELIEKVINHFIL